MQSTLFKLHTLLSLSILDAYSRTCHGPSASRVRFLLCSFAYYVNLLRSLARKTHRPFFDGITNVYSSLSLVFKENCATALDHGSNLPNPRMVHLQMAF